MEVKQKYRIHTDSKKKINWSYGKEDNIRIKGETLIWTDGSVRIHNNKRIAIGAIYHNKKSTRNRMFIIEGRLKTSYIAECTVIEEAIINLLKNENIRIITDSKSFTKNEKMESEETV